MFAKIITICSVAAVASAVAPGYVSSAYALGTQAEHTIRGYGGLSSVSKQAKTIDSPYATVRKTDIRYTNDAAYAPHPVTYGHPYGAPAIGYHTPAFAHHGYNAPALGYGYRPAIHGGYHAAGPAIAGGYHHAPLGAAVTYAHPGYAAAAPAPIHAPYGYGARGVALPAAHLATKVGVPAGLGVAYSPATSVATSSFSGHGVHYGY